MESISNHLTNCVNSTNVPTTEYLLKCCRSVLLLAWFNILLGALKLTLAICNNK